MIPRSAPTLSRAKIDLCVERRALERMRRQLHEGNRALVVAEEQEEICDKQADEAARHREEVICPDVI